MLSSALTVGLRTLAANPLRTCLSTLGVVIGTAALVAVLALGDGVERYAREQIASTTDLQLFSITSETRRRIDGIWLPRADTMLLDTQRLVQLRSRLGPGVALVLSRRGGAVMGGIPGDSARGAMVVAHAGERAVVVTDSVRAGRDLGSSEAEGEASVAVISPDLAALLGGPESALGRTVEFSGHPFLVVGVAGNPGREEPVLSAQVPYGAWPRAVSPGMQGMPTLVGQVRDLDAMPAVVAAARTWASAHGEGALTVSNRQDMLVEVRRGMMVAKLLMGSITGISLVVGGIGIMNVLLASVFERTREIGIRRATGATRRHILSQFLAESVVITSVGSVAGLLLGMVGAFGVSWVMRAQSDAPVHAAFTPLPIIVAALSAVIVGLLAGMYPAARASRLSPIDAIRTE
jgi:putative ABC transport system permease protein